MKNQSNQALLRNLPTLAVEYQTAIDAGSPKPIILRLGVNDRPLVATCWTATHAEAMAYSLLKSVEIYRRDFAKPKLILPE